jgi:ubiquinone/menaquinone biosynthesis C-methylase UbiE
VLWRVSISQKSNHDPSDHYDLIQDYFRKDVQDKKNYYSSYDKEKLHDQIKRREMWGCYQSSLQYIIDLDKNLLSVIDLGCGMGNFLLELKISSQFNSIAGLDFLKETYALALDHKELFNNIDFIQGSLIDIPCKSDSYDVSFCLNVLHHIHPNDIAQVINEIERITKKFIIVEIRNNHSLFHLWYSSIIKKKYEGRLPIQSMNIKNLNNFFKHSKLIKSVGKHYLNLLNHRILLIYEKEKN